MAVCLIRAALGSTVRETKEMAMSKPTDETRNEQGWSTSRRAGRTFIPLTDLLQDRMTKQDLMRVLPALVLSLLLNAMLIASLLLFNNNKTDTNKSASNAAAQARAIDQKTAFDPKPKDDFIDPGAVDLAIGDAALDTEIKIPADQAKPELDVGLDLLKDPTKPSGIGSGSEGGIQGANGNDLKGLSGMPLVGQEYGFSGNHGAGPVGDGVGLLEGLGGGSVKAGGTALRNGDLNKIAGIMGGTDASQRAVAMGLQWLKKHQASDGHWSMEDYQRHSPGCNCRVQIELELQPNDTAATALGLLPFLGAGHTHLKPTPYRDTVAAALQYLMRRFDQQGDLGGTMYGHALATIALCEAYAATRDPKLRDSAQRAVNFIVYAQNPRTGGWRYRPRTNGDTSVLGWQIMALKSAELSDLKVPPKTFDLANQFLDACQIKIKLPEVPNTEFVGFSYMPGEYETLALSSAGLLSREYLGWGAKNPDLVSGCNYLIQRLPPKVEEFQPGDRLQLYYWYYATQVLHHMSGPYFEKWNPRVRDLLVKTQELEGHKAGSWDPTIADHGGRGGRIYSTSLAVLTLEVYYRYLPLYRRDFINQIKGKNKESD